MTTSTAIAANASPFEDYVRPVRQQKQRFYSDIDLAVWGLSCDRYCEAVGTLLCNLKNFSIDLVMLETAQPSLLNHILTHGVSL